MMTRDHEPKTISSSRTQLAQVMMPEHANTHGNVHGGWIMKLVDEAGALASTRHAGHRTVTVTMDQMVFRYPIHIGDLVLLNAEVTFAGRTSMEVDVNVVAENPITGVKISTNNAYLVYVAIDDHGRPTRIPPLLAETTEEKEKMKAAQLRHENRLALMQKRS
jgi:acyl-CoA hydrolase